MKAYTRTRLAVAAALMAALSLTTVGAAAVSADASGVQTLRTGDHWPF